MDKIAGKITRVVARSKLPTSSITFETGNLAGLANGACTCKLGDTSVLVTAVCDKPKKPTGGFVPMTVDYREKSAALGRIPTTHLRRDIGTTEKETLTARMIDRSIRPAFPKGFYNETQIICNLLALDGYNDADVLAINGASASLAISDIPWSGPIGAARVSLLGERPIINPTRKELENSRLNLVVAINHLGNLMMLEGFGREPILMPDILKAIKLGAKECKTIVEAIAKLQSSIGKPKRPIDLSYHPKQEHDDLVAKLGKNQVRAVLTDYELDKVARDNGLTLIRQMVVAEMHNQFPDVDSVVSDISFSNLVRSTYRQLVQETKTRCDGRKLDELRPIECEVNLYAPLHGSAKFKRGQTVVQCSTTFDSPDTAFSLSDVKEKNFMLHYEFPPYATNEIGRVGSLPGRREIGHGALAERGIRPLVPDNHEMTIRLCCEVLASNGSSSMASVCAGSLSLMDAGVDLKEHVAGVAMGLMGCSKDKSNTDESNHVILTDILGFEDYMGDMDLKIAGTRKALTAIQLDVKPIDGISPNIIYEAIQKSHAAKSIIIGKMEGAIRSPRKERKDNHPVMKTITIPPQKQAQIIGLGGASIKKLKLMMTKIGVRISSYNDVNLDDMGTNMMLFLFAPNKDAMQEAEEYINKLLEQQREPDLEFNGIYTATIQEIRPNGVMVSLYPNMKPTLLSLAQLDMRVVSHPEALNMEVGQQIQVKYFGRDPATGHMRLSRKTLQLSSAPRIHNMSEK